MESEANDGSPHRGACPGLKPRADNESRLKPALRRAAARAAAVVSRGVSRAEVDAAPPAGHKLGGVGIPPLGMCPEWVA